MKLNIKIKEFQIDKEKIEEIDKEARDLGLTYIIEESGIENFNHYYYTKDYIFLEKDDYLEYINKINIWHNKIMPKIVEHIFNNGNLDYFEFGEDLKQVLLYDYINLTKTSKNLNFITYLGRYDLLVNQNNEVKIVELNAETPAGFPETMLSPIIYFPKLKNNENIFDENSYIETRLISTIKDEFKDNSNLLVMYGKAIEEFEVLHEDYLNALHIGGFLNRNIQSNPYVSIKENINVLINPIDNLVLDKEDLFLRIKVDGYENENGEFIKGDGGLYTLKKIDTIWSFYPLEWIFEEGEAGKAFWNLYINGKFNMINKPITLIPQNKFFWAYIYDIFLKDEKNIGKYLGEELKDIYISIIKELIPLSHKNKENFPKSVEYIKKAVFHREGFGIDIDENFKDGNMGFVYQEKIDQKVFSFNTFYSNSQAHTNIFNNSEEGKQKGYLTLGLYAGKQGVIGIYNRFCENKITDDTAYTMPLFCKI